MSDFLTSPPWQREDLGLALPDSPHAVSVSLPLWEHVVGYEEGDAVVLNAMRTGYPRFFMPRVVVELCERVATEAGAEGEKCLLFPTMAAAERCAIFIRDRHDGWVVRTEAIEEKGVFATWFPQQVEATARRYWRFCGEIIGSRQAVNLLNDREAGAEASRLIRERLAGYSGQSAEDVYLFEHIRYVMHSLCFPKRFKRILKNF